MSLSCLYSRPADRYCCLELEQIDLNNLHAAAFINSENYISGKFKKLPESLRSTITTEQEVEGTEKGERRKHIIV